MIRMNNVSKIYHIRTGDVTILDQVNLELPSGRRLGILGRNGAGKSTMIRLLSGAERQTSGEIHRGMSVSWPLAFGGAFQGSLSGADNLRFICRIYGIEWRDAMDFVADFSELGAYLREPVRTYSSGMRARLAFAISMVVEFDCFLIDEIIAVGDNRFHQKCHTELFEKRGERSMVIVSHDAGYIREHCHSAAVLKDRQLQHFDEVEHAFEFYNA
jgi:capsular polysaccharide transport system ATP-binding protein